MEIHKWTFREMELSGSSLKLWIKWENSKFRTEMLSIHNCIGWMISAEKGIYGMIHEHVMRIITYSCRRGNWILDGMRKRDWIEENCNRTIKITPRKSTKTKERLRLQRRKQDKRHKWQEVNCSEQQTERKKDRGGKNRSVPLRVPGECLMPIGQKGTEEFECMCV